MRLRVEVTTSASELPWASVLRPGRSFVYGLLAKGSPELGHQLHEDGYGAHRMAPYGYGAPVFPGALRKRGIYAVGGAGTFELGSPVPDILMAWASALPRCDVIDWGGVALRVRKYAVIAPPEFSSGFARFRTETPVVMKGSGRDENGIRQTRQAWVLPTDPEFGAYFAGNLRRKARTLGIDEDIDLTAITWIGPKRSFAVSDGLKPGAAVEVQLRGSPGTLQAIWSWGLGQANSAGFGWVAA